MLRSGKSKVVNLTLGQLPNAQEAKADTDTDSKGSTTDVPRLGMTVAPADKVEGTGKNGVVVTKVDPKSAAADRGFKKGDVILEVAGKSVATAGDVREAIEAARTDKKSSVLMRLPFRRRVPLRRRAARKRLKMQEIGSGRHGRCRSSVRRRYPAKRSQTLKHDGIRFGCCHEGSALPLPLAGEGWGGGVSTSRTVCGESPHPDRIHDAIRPKSELRSSRPPHAGEVKCACG